MPSFGESLKRERELREITLREISEATKINLRYLESLEKNDFRHLPGGVFNKGFVRAYAEFIGVDAEGMVNAYLLEDQRQRARFEERNAEALRRSAVERANDSPPRPPIGRLALAVAALLIVLSVLVWVAWKGFFAERAWFRAHEAVASPPAAAPASSDALPSPTPSPGLDASSGPAPGEEHP